MAFGLVMASLVLLLSVFAMILEGPMWRITLRRAVLISENDCSDVQENCVCPEGGLQPIIIYRQINPPFSVCTTLKCAFIY